MNLNYTAVGICVIGLILLYAFVWVFIKPIKFLLKILLNSAIGLSVLALFNFMAPSLNMAVIGINTYTASVCGLLGVPGYLMLIAIRAIY